MLSNLPRASITPWLHAASLPFLKYVRGAMHLSLEGTRKPRGYLFCQRWLRGWNSRWSRKLCWVLTPPPPSAPSPGERRRDLTPLSLDIVWTDVKMVEAISLVTLGLGKSPIVQQFFRLTVNSVWTYESTTIISVWMGYSGLSWIFADIYWETVLATTCKKGC